MSRARQKIGTAEFSRFLRLCVTGRQEAPRVRRKEHLTIENAMLRRRSLSAFSHNQDPQRNRGLAITSLNFVLVEAASTGSS